MPAGAGPRVGVLIVVLTLVAVSASLGRADIHRLQKANTEREAVKSLRTINHAQAAYAAECGRTNYATSLMDLATRPPGKNEAFLPWQKGQLGWTITPDVKGYFFTIRPGRGAVPGTNDCNDFQTQTRYYALAVPTAQGITGDRTFATNQEGVVWESNRLPPPLEPFGPPARRTP